jgi:hypothetical protein
MPVIPALGRWRQEDQEIVTNSGKVSETLSQKAKIRLSVVTHAYNPNYSEEKDLSLRPVKAKS